MSELDLIKLAAQEMHDFSGIEMIALDGHYNAKRARKAMGEGNYESIHRWNELVAKKLDEIARLHGRVHDRARRARANL